ncbi:type I restriction-modification system specificity subunit [Methanosarcina mazei Go1]|uniref:Type I restriction-modification system specificity subunit n=1 Tax=Methanosarcina mazei (strain ATCC BAA-159 / DSM 3647 / Goe1 / Go1 / JCM 11833 / OCM 88) TaxID=192952 RepID=Q8PUN9_METMA|nr:restriction endonuclease subunit S [Methanosarcina mazei]AAM31989.1 type I restriction-modification system specificity subunit [Methanosarcina mazei Go1]WIM42163.1 restriction endonuclease subunit S [Methanosarcina mazei]WIM45712.1 restriction endonuclease subunit S [Methanosarcina mazei]
MSAEGIAENIPPGYKQTEVGVIPEDWNDPKLEDIVKEESPICYGIVQVGSYTANGIPVLAIKNLNSDYTTNIHRASVEVERPYLRSRVYPEDVLISVKGTTGRIGIVPLGFYGNISRDLARLHLREGIVPKFIFQMLQSNLMQQHLGVAVVGTTRMELSISILKKVRIPFPPTKAEQESIAEALSYTDAFIESLEQLIAKKRQIKQGAMQELLTGKRRLPGFSKEWETKPLGDVAEITMGQSPSSANYNSKGEGLPLIQGNADIFNRKTIKRVFTTEITRRGKCGDIIMSVRAPVGEVSRAEFDICLGRGVCAIRYSNNFLYHTLISKESTWAKLSKGSTFDSVNSADVKAFDIELPTDSAEQEAIATILSDMDAEITALEEKLAKARQIKQGMMQELLTGRTRLV